MVTFFYDLDCKGECRNADSFQERPRCLNQRVLFTTNVFDLLAAYPLFNRACPRCAGEMGFISFITDPQLIGQILEHLTADSETPLRTEALRRPAQPRTLS